jgi:hypothetical protein
MADVFQWLQMVKLPEFHNHKPAAIWIISGFWITGLLIVTYLLARDGAPPELTPLMTGVVVTGFWLGAIGLITYISGKACTTVKIQMDRCVKIVQQFPFKRLEKVVPFSSVRNAEVLTVSDIDGDPYFKACFFLDDQKIVLIESSDKTACQKAVDQFDAALKS